MKNLWSDRAASAFATRLARAGISRELALRVYSSRLLGGNPALVLHGGGNTSLKTSGRDLTGEVIDILYMKGSGRDLGAIEADGFPALRLAPLRALAKRKKLSDSQMLDALASAKLVATAPAPSVETLLHAFLPARFIDHTHANALLALTNQERGNALCAEVFGDRVAVIPYAMSGFALAAAAKKAVEANPDAEGLIVMQHGLFTFGETAKEAYGRMIDLVGRAERRLAKGQKNKVRKVFATRALPKKTASVAEVAPVLRGLIHDDGMLPLIADFRTGAAIRAFVDGRDLARYGTAGTATPDHVIRTKPTPLIAPVPVAGNLDAFRADTAKAVAAFKKNYKAYTARNKKRVKDVAFADPLPRIVLVPGLGLFGLGENARAARIAADIAEANISTIADAERIGTFKGLPESDVFDIEYWPPERAKLGRAVAPALQGRVVLVTGAASGIGLATAKAFGSAGAEVVLTDLHKKSVEAAAADVGGLGLVCDVTKPAQVRRAFDKACETFGGIDIVVSNAGAAWQGEIGTVDDATLRKSFELNFFAHQSVAQNAVRVMRAQGKGGCLLFNTSKQAVNPGENFGPYGLPKAATLFLVRQYAVDHGKDGIRANAVNADRIRSGLLTDAMIKSRAKARKLSEADYMGGNLLGREVTAEDVAQAFVSLALAESSTGAVLTVDGGNIAAALR